MGRTLVRSPEDEMGGGRVGRDTRGIPRAPIMEPTGLTDKVIDFSLRHDVGPDYEELAHKIDTLARRADEDLLPKFDAFFGLMGIP